MMTWWDARTRREQVLLALMAGALALFVLWFGVVRPLDRAHAAAQARYEAALADEATASRAVARIRALPRPSAASSVSPAEAVNASAAAAGLPLARVEPDPAGGVRVAVAAATPVRLFPWLASLQQQYGLAASHLTVVKDDMGALSVDATFGAAR